jgi:hypothetical protein
MPRTYYRIVTAAPPPVEDFASDAALGYPPPADDPVRFRLHDGISVYATETQARNKARAFADFGAYLARLAIPAGAPIRIERTLSSRGHHTLWGDAEAIRRCVVDVLAV